MWSIFRPMSPSMGVDITVKQLKHITFSLLAHNSLLGADLFLQTGAWGLVRIIEKNDTRAQQES